MKFDYGLDGHGSVRFLTDSTGAVTDTYDYDAFGNLIAQTGTTVNNYLFAGEQFDPALGIYYNRARYYDQRQGRFWSMDEVGGDPQSPASLHRYLYDGANPVDNIDPSGNEIEEFNIATAINITLSAMNAISFVGNTQVAAQSAISAYSFFQNDDPWNGTLSIANAVLHLGVAALCAYGVKTSLNLPPPPAAFAPAVGNLAVQTLWLNPQFVSWTFELLWPAVIGIGGMYFASAGHSAEWELRNSKGQIRTRGNAESGGTHPGRRLSFQEQLETHTEQQILNQIKDEVEEGDIVTIRGSKPPCAPGFGTQGCTPAMQRFAQQRGVKILYSVDEDVWIFNPDGSIVKP